MQGALDAAWRAWLDSLTLFDDPSAKHKQSLETSRRYLERANARANVADLPALFEQLRGTLGKEHRRSFNLLRSAALAFLRDTLKRSHPLWLAVAANRVHIEGTKRAGRVRDVPLVTAPAVPRLHRRTFEHGVRERSRDLTPYDLRRSYANWLEAAGIPRTRRRLYFGHGAGDVADL